MQYVFNKKTQYLLFLFFSCFPCYTPFIYSKIIIFTYAYNRPEFIVLQDRTFKKFLQDDYEFIVFNDATQINDYHTIKNTCHLLGITCIDIPQKIHDRPYLHRPSKTRYAPYHQPSVRNSNVVQYSLDMLGFDHDDILMLIDSDMFLIKEFNIKKFMQGYDLAGFFKTNDPKRIRNINSMRFLWIGLVFLDMNALSHKTALNFNCGIHDNLLLDAGGFTGCYLKYITTGNHQPIDRVCLRDLVCEQCTSTKSTHCNHNTQLLKKHGFSKNLIALVQQMPLLYGKDSHRNSEFFLNHSFFHYRAGSNYNNASENYVHEKTIIFNNFINKLLEQ